MKLKSKLFSTVGASILVLGMFVNGARAADLEPVMAGPNWDRFYFGGNIGANIGFAEDLDSTEFRGYEQGFGAGLQFGRNWDSGNFIWGIEADIGLGGLVWDGGGDEHKGAVNLLSSVRGRLGLPFGNHLAYVTAGAGMVYGEAFSTSATSSNGGKWDVRPVVGLGFESMVTPSMSLKAEGLAFIGSHEADNGEGSTVRFDTVGVIRLGANFLFGAPGGAEIEMPTMHADWNRFYMGGHIGGNIGFNQDQESTDFNHTEQGVMAGLQIGANFDQGSFIWGVEFDVSNGGLTWGEGSYHRVDLQVVSSLRGRIGVAVDNHLIYATAGAGMMWAWAGDSTTPSNDEFLVRPVVGVGVESMITESISVKAEGLAWIGDDNVRWDVTSGGEVSSYGKMETIGTIRVGVNFHL